MAAISYSTKVEANEAKAVGVSLPISFKMGVEVCNHIRGKKLSIARNALNQAIAMKTPIPFRVYNQEMAHNSGVGSGRYPVNVCKAISALLDSAESNAQLKGMNTSALIIRHISCHKAGLKHHYGRHGRKGKNSHLEIVLAEEKVKPKQEKKSKAKEASA